MRKRSTAVALCFLMLLLPIPIAASAANIPQKIDAPKNVAVSVLPDQDGYIWNYEIGYTVPGNVLLFAGVGKDAWYEDDLMSNLSIFGEFDYKYNESGRWHQNASWDTAENAPNPFNYGYLTDISDNTPDQVMYINSGSLSPSVDNSSTLKNNTLWFRIRFIISYYNTDGEMVKLISPWSEAAAIGKDAGKQDVKPVVINTRPPYGGASPWAVPELDKAAGYGLITDRIRGNMARNITREEFAEVAVRFYEVYTGKNAQAGSVSFSDTTNPEVLKAVKLKLMTGTGPELFGPNLLITRETMATILYRSAKLVNPTADFSAAGAAIFADDASIAAWAKEAVYYCGKTGIIRGDGKKRFNPKSLSTREVAVIAYTRAYELHKGIAAQSSPASPSSASPPPASAPGGSTPHSSPAPPVSTPPPTSAQD